MRHTLLLENMPLFIAIVFGAYVWYRAGFRTPKVLPFAARTTRRIIVALGWTFVVAVTAKSVAASFPGDGRVAIAKRGQMYAYRAHEPVVFWTEIAGEMLVVGGTGAFLVFLGRRSPRRGGA
jgi:hypothetical protein